MKLVGKGAEAELYEAEIIGKTAVIKDRIRKKYRIPQIDVELRKTRTKREAKLLTEAKIAGVRCPLVYQIGEFTITMSRIGGKLMKDSLKGRRLPGNLRTAGKYLALLHLAGIIHGDYTTANVMVDGTEVTIIDFGLGSFSEDLEDKAVDVLLMKKSLGSKKLYAHFLSGYAKANPKSKKVLERLAEVERRGRYVVRAMQG
ncbi:MAG: KEOPS complex kinase/ATPase Bud32 [Candidatus Micrarchaeota archaeon]|nr:KEOPS complex kinase/ATPase Bud32 [Candidatus Micrarchaeota archaeon]